MSGTASESESAWFVGGEPIWDSILLYKEKRKLLLIQTWTVLFWLS